MRLSIFIGTFLVFIQSARGSSYDDLTMVLDRGYSSTFDPFAPPEEREDTPNAFQSDMLLTPEQQLIIDELIAEHQTGISKRRAKKALAYRWPQNTMPYVIHSSSENDRAEIEAGINMWTHNTCARIVPYTPEIAAQLGHDNRIMFYYGAGCASFVGMLGVGLQEVNIGFGCASAGVVAHEIGHCLGWHHEHSRTDRDDYVTVLSENIQEGKARNFAVYESDTYGVPYDVLSLMHYGTSYFSANGKPTMVANDLLKHYFMGNRNGLTFYDLKMAHIMLNCSSECVDPIDCFNEGFLGEDCTCTCKPGFIGDQCESVDPQYSGQEGLHILTAPTGKMVSPVFTGIGGHPITIWEIVGGDNTVISIVFTYFEMMTSYNCAYDRVVIQEGNDIESGATRYCGSSLPPRYQSNSKYLLVVYEPFFAADSSGFEAEYTITDGATGDSIETPTIKPTTTVPSTTTETPTTVASTTTLQSTTTPLSTTETPVPEINCDNAKGTCGGYFYGSGCIASPNYEDGEYENGQNCHYNLEVPEDQRVEFIILDMNIEQDPGNDCIYDKLSIFMGDYSLIGSMFTCGTSIPKGSFISTTHKMELFFNTDSSVTKKGFMAKFRGVSI